MNQKLKRFFAITVLLCSRISSTDYANSCSSCPTSCAQAQNLYQPHAFTASASREIMLEIAAWNPMNDEEGMFGTFGVGFDYMRSFNSKCCSSSESTGCCTTLGSLPFWAADGSNTMTLGGNTSGKDVDAYQFGLGPVTTTGTVTLKPTVFQAGADFLLYIGAHKTERGFFIKIHAPVGVTNINPGLSFTDGLEAVAYPQGSLQNVAATTTPAPYQNIKEAFAGGQTAGYLKSMNKGLINCTRTSSARFGDAEFAVGYNVYADETKHLGIAVRFSAPTGNKAEGIYVLEPIFGRNGHWGAGGEIMGHWKFWDSDTKHRFSQIFLEGNVLHLFTSHHARSFDLAANGPGSKYMLIAKYLGTPGVFQSEIINAVNVTTINIDSTFAAEGVFALGFDFHWNNWSLEVGYEGWGRTCEKIMLDCNCPGSTNYNDYAVLGRQTPFSSANGTTVINLCEPKATIGASQNQVNAAVPADGIVDATAAINRIAGDPALALDIDAQRARAVYTSKPYVEIRYTWNESDYTPFLAITGGAEIPNLHKNEAVAMWNFGVNGGIAF